MTDWLLLQLWALLNIKSGQISSQVLCSTRALYFHLMSIFFVAAATATLRWGGPRATTSSQRRWRLLGWCSRNQRATGLQGDSVTVWHDICVFTLYAPSGQVASCLRFQGSENQYWIKCDAASSCHAEGICVEIVTAPSNVAILVRNVKLLSSVWWLMWKRSRSLTKAAWFKGSLNMSIWNVGFRLETRDCSSLTLQLHLLHETPMADWMFLTFSCVTVVAVKLHAEAGKIILRTRWSASPMAILGSKSGHAWSSRPTRLWWATHFQVEWWRWASTERTWDSSLTAVRSAFHVTFQWLHLRSTLKCFSGTFKNKVRSSQVKIPCNQVEWIWTWTWSSKIPIRSSSM